MSRVGKQPIPVPEGVKVTVQGQQVEASGPLGSLRLSVHPEIKVKLDNKTILFERSNDSSHAKSLHGTARSLINNLILGVHKGYQKDLSLVGVGYRAQLAGATLQLQVGFSHPVDFAIPKGITCTVDKQTNITLKGIDKSLLGLTAARLRKIKPPEPYQGKGIRYAKEVVIKKAGKTAATTSGGAGAAGGKK